MYKDALPLETFGHCFPEFQPITSDIDAIGLAGRFDEFNKKITKA